MYDYNINIYRKGKNVYVVWNREDDDHIYALRKQKYSHYHADIQINLCDLIVIYKIWNSFLVGIKKYISIINLTMLVIYMFTILHINAT